MCLHPDIVSRLFLQTTCKGEYVSGEDYGVVVLVFPPHSYLIPVRGMLAELRLNLILHETARVQKALHLH